MAKEKILPAEAKAEKEEILVLVEPAVPNGVSPEKQKRLRAQALGLEKKCNSLSSGGLISHLGEYVREPVNKLDALGVRFVDLVNESSGRKDIVLADLQELNTAITDLIPAQGILERAKRFLGKIRSKAGISDAEDQIGQVVSRLREGEDDLLKNVIYLGSLQDGLREALEQTKEKVYTLEMVQRARQEKYQEVPDDQKKEVFMSLVVISRELTKLREKEFSKSATVVMSQEIAEIFILLRFYIDSVLERFLDTVPEQMAVRKILADGRGMIDAARKTAEFTTRLVLGNALEIERQVDDASAAFKSPVLDIQACREVKEILSRSLGKLQVAFREGFKAGAKNQAEFAQMSREIQGILLDSGVALLPDEAGSEIRLLKGPPPDTARKEEGEKKHGRKKRKR